MTRSALGRLQAYILHSDRASIRALSLDLETETKARLLRLAPKPEDSVHVPAPPRLARLHVLHHQASLWPAILHGSASRAWQREERSTCLICGAGRRRQSERCHCSRCRVWTSETGGGCAKRLRQCDPWAKFGPNLVELGAHLVEIVRIQAKAAGSKSPGDGPVSAKFAPRSRRNLGEVDRIGRELGPLSGTLRICTARFLER